MGLKNQFTSAVHAAAEIHSRMIEQQVTHDAQEKLESQGLDRFDKTPVLDAPQM